MAKYINLASLKDSMEKVKAYVDARDAVLLGTGATESGATSIGALKLYIDQKTTGIASDATVANKVDKVDGMGLSHNDYDDAAVTKLAGIEEGAQVNVIESVAEGTDSDYLTVSTTGKAVSVTFSKGSGDAELYTKSQVDAAITAAAYDDTALAGRVSTIEGDYLKAADKSALESAIGTVSGRVDSIEADYLKAADKTALEGAIGTVSGRVDTVEASLNAFLADADTTEKAVNTLKEIQEYIASDSGVSENFLAIQSAVTASTTGLQDKVAALEAKHAEGKSVADEVSDGISALDLANTYAAKSHTHAISDVTDLQTTLDGKSNTGHTHAISEVTGLQDALDAKAESSVIGALPEGKTVAEAIADAQAAATYDDTALAGRVSAVETSLAENGATASAIAANTSAINTLKGDANTEGSVAKAIADAIAAQNISTTYVSKNSVSESNGTVSIDSVTIEPEDGVAAMLTEVFGA